MPPERLEPRLHPRLPLYSPGAELAKEEKGRAVGNRRWKARLVVFVLSLALALVLLVVDRYGEWGPAGLLSLGALLLLIVPNAGWAHLELPTPLRKMKGPKALHCLPGSESWSSRWRLPVGRWRFSSCRRSLTSLFL
jgi:hypothetical protein